MRARDFCVAVKRLARLQSTIRQYNVRDTPDAVFAGIAGGREGCKGGYARGRRGEGDSDDEGVDFEQTLKSRQF